MKHCQYHSGQTVIKTLKQGVKFVQTYQVYYNENLEHLLRPILMLLFKILIAKCWLEVRRELFCQNNTAVLNTHITAPV